MKDIYRNEVRVASLSKVLEITCCSNSSFWSTPFKAQGSWWAWNHDSLALLQGFKAGLSPLALVIQCLKLTCWPLVLPVLPATIQELILSIVSLVKSPEIWLADLTNALGIAVQGRVPWQENVDLKNDNVEGKIHFRREQLKCVIEN